MNGKNINYTIHETLLVSLIGRFENDAIGFCTSLGFHSRIVSRDSKNYVITSDFILNRVNMTIENGVVSKYDIG